MNGTLMASSARRQVCDDVIEWVNETRHAVGAPLLAVDDILSQYGL